MEETRNPTDSVPGGGTEKRGWLSSRQPFAGTTQHPAVEPCSSEDNGSVMSDSPCSSASLSASSAASASPVDSSRVTAQCQTTSSSSVDTPSAPRPGFASLAFPDCSLGYSVLRNSQAGPRVFPTVRFLSRLLASRDEERIGISPHEGNKGLPDFSVTRLRLLGFPSSSLSACPFPAASSSICPSSQVSCLSPPFSRIFPLLPAVATPEAALPTRRSSGVAPALSTNVPVSPPSLPQSLSFRLLSSHPNSFAPRRERSTFGVMARSFAVFPASDGSLEDSQEGQASVECREAERESLQEAAVFFSKQLANAPPSEDQFSSAATSSSPLRISDGAKKFAAPSLLPAISPRAPPPSQSLADKPYLGSCMDLARLTAAPSSATLVESSDSFPSRSSCATSFPHPAFLASILSYPLFFNRDSFSIAPSSSPSASPSSPPLPSSRSPPQASSSQPPAWPAGPLRFFPAFPVHRCRGVSVTVPPSGEKVCFGQFEETAGILLLSPEQLDGLAVASKSPFFDGFVLRHLSPSLAAQDARRKAAAVLAAAAKLGKGGSGGRMYEGEKQNESATSRPPVPDRTGRRSDSSREEGQTSVATENKNNERPRAPPRPENQDCENVPESPSGKLRGGRRAVGGSKDSEGAEAVGVKSEGERSVFPNRGGREDKQREAEEAEEEKVHVQKERATEGQHRGRTEEGGFVRGRTAGSPSGVLPTAREGGQETARAKGERPGLKTLDRLEGVLTRAEDLAPLIAGEPQCSFHGRLVQFSQGKTDDWNLCVGDCYWLAMKIPLQSCNPFIFFKNEAIVKIDAPNNASPRSSSHTHRDPVGEPSSHGSSVPSRSRGLSNQPPASASSPEHSRAGYPGSSHSGQLGSNDPSHNGSSYSPAQQPQDRDSLSKKPHPPYPPPPRQQSRYSPPPPYGPDHGQGQSGEDSQVPDPRAPPPRDHTSYPPSYVSPVEPTSPPYKPRDSYSSPGAPLSPTSSAAGGPWTPEGTPDAPHPAPESDDFSQHRGETSRRLRAEGQDAQDGTRGLEPTESKGRPDVPWAPQKPGVGKEEPTDDLSIRPGLKEWLTHEALKRYRRLMEAAPEALSRAADRLKDGVPQSADDALGMGKRCAEFPQWAFQYVTDAARQLGGSVRQAALELWNFIFSEGGGGAPGSEGGGG